MKAFDPSKLPVLSTLAREFVLCDRWFASVPGQTWPNRFFVHAATSGGFVDNNFRNYTFRTIYDNLEEQGYSWAIYFHDFPQSLHHLVVAEAAVFESLQEFAPILRRSRDRAPAGVFVHRAQILRLPALESERSASAARCAAGRAPRRRRLRIAPPDRRSGSRACCSCCMTSTAASSIIVPPPAAVNPDGLVSATPPFDFKRLGVRVPSLIVSPHVGKGVVDSTVYDHTSILATVRELFNLPRALTERDRQANTVSRNSEGAGARGRPDDGAAATRADRRCVPRELRDRKNDGGERVAGPRARSGIHGATVGVSGQPGRGGERAPGRSAAARRRAHAGAAGGQRARRRRSRPRDRHTRARERRHDAPAGRQASAEARQTEAKAKGPASKSKASPMSSRCSDSARLFRRR